jgi:hypothetical protein
MRASFFAFMVTVTSAGPAAAHIQLISPVQRHADQKVGPCGIGADDMRGPDVTVFAPGETIVVSWTETVEHPGHFRISFDADGHDDFVDPASYDDYYSNAAVLVDEIADKPAGLYEVEVTLPDIECDSCTLQVVQVMTDKPPYQIGTNDLYYQCADISLVGAPQGTSTGPDTTTTGDTDTAGETAGTTGEEPGNTVTGGCGVVQTVGCGSFSDSDPFTTGGDATGGQPTTAATTGADGGASEGTGTTGAATTTAPMTTTATDPMTPDDDDKGCGCREDAGGPAWLALGLVPLLRRRRRA